MRALLALLPQSRRAHKAAQQAFPPATLATIGAMLAAGACRHRAEIRIIIDTVRFGRAQATGHVLPGGSTHPARARATQLFADHRIWDTEHNCGVLLYVNLTERKVELIADRNVGRALTPDQWHAVCATLTEGFRRKQFAESLVAALDALHALLENSYPAGTAQHVSSSAPPLVL